MSYRNISSRALPGLIIMIIDHSYMMDMHKINMQSISTIDLLLNALMEEWRLKLMECNSDGEDIVRDLLYLCCIVHKAGTAYVYKEGPVSSFEDAPKVVVPAEILGCTLEMSINIQTDNAENSNLTQALILAKQRILEWKFAHIQDIENMSIPMVLNFLNRPVITENLKDLECAANALTNIPFPDGKPLLLNILLGKNYEGIFFPKCEQEMGIYSAEASVLFRISSIFDKQLKERNEEKLILCDNAHWLALENGCRLIVGGDVQHIFSAIVGFPMWIHLRGIE